MLHPLGSLLVANYTPCYKFLSQSFCFCMTWQRLFTVVQPSLALDINLYTIRSLRICSLANHIKSGTSPCSQASHHAHKRHMACASRAPQSFPLLNGDDREFWVDVLDQVRDKKAQGLAASLVMDNVIGIQPLERKRQAMAYLDLVRKVKKQNPRHLILIRGDQVYEAVGFDAIVCLEILGRGSGILINPPRVRYPVRRIDELVDRLISKGFVVVVCEKDEDKSLQWFVSQMISPANPCYVRRPDEEAASSVLLDGAYESSSPIIGVFSDSKGYTMMEFWGAQSVVEVSQGLTQEGVWARIQSGGFAPPLHLHDGCLKTKKKGSNSRLPLDLSEWKAQMSKMSPVMTTTLQLYRTKNPSDGFLEIVQDIMGVPAEHPIPLIVKEDVSLRKPSFNTICQLGLAEEEIPGLVSLGDVLLPKSAPKSVARLLQRLLMAPPPLPVCQKIHEACCALVDTEVAIPRLKLIPPNKVSQVLDAGMKSSAFFCDLRTMVNRASEVLLKHEELSRSLIPIVNFESARAVTYEELKETCAEVGKAISEVVPFEVGGDDKKEGSSIWVTESALRALFNHTQNFRKHVQQDEISQSFSSVVDAQKEVEDSLSEIWNMVMERRADLPTRFNRAVFNKDASAVYVKLGRWANTDKVLKKNLIQPGTAFKRRSMQGIWSSEALEEALHKYRVACRDAKSAATQRLGLLGERLKHHMLHLVGVAHFSLITMMLVMHADEALRKGWAVPDISHFVEKEPGVIKLEGFWPYWLPKEAPSTVFNSLKINEMIMLTGPNMGGKSTLLRSIAAVCLLGTTGLMVPAESARIPFLDNVVMRAFIGDSPKQGESSHSLEMLELASVLREASQDSLVLLDELGRGTGIREGAGMGGAVLEELAERGCKGIFSSHLHHLKYLPLNKGKISHMQMEIGFQDRGHPILGELRCPTWKVVEGTGEDTMAMQVALECGVPGHIVAEASKLHQEILGLGRSAFVSGQHILNAANRAGFSADYQIQDDDQVDSTFPGTPLASEPSAVQAHLDDAKEILVKLLHHFEVYGEDKDVKVYQLPPEARVPPRVSLMSCVYIIRWPDAQFYVGETDDLQGRMESHRFKREGRMRRGMEAIYTAVPKSEGSKSMARRIEAATINELNRSGFRLWSGADAQHVRFGSS